MQAPALHLLMALMQMMAPVQRKHAECQDVGQVLF